MAIITLATLRDYWKKVYDSIVAHDAVDSGDPLKIGGKASTAAPAAVSVNDRVNAWFDLNGRLMVKHDQSIPIDQTTPGTTNGVVVNSSALPTGAATSVKQDTLIAKDFATQVTLAALLAKVIAAPSTEAKQDSLITLLTNVEATALASAARTATVSSADLINSSGKGIHVILDVTIDPAAASITLTIEGKDPASGKYYPLLVSAAVNSVITNVYRVHPDLTASPNLIVNDFVPKTFRVTLTHSNADSITYSVGYSLV
jgi:hypothetical protein